MSTRPGTSLRFYGLSSVVGSRLRSWHRARQARLRHRRWQLRSESGKNSWQKSKLQFHSSYLHSSPKISSRFRCNGGRRIVHSAIVRTPLEFTPRSSVSFDDFSDSGGLSCPVSDEEEFEVQKHEALRELQQLVNRYNDCFLHLKDVAATNEFLRKENRPPAVTGSPSEKRRDLLDSPGDSGTGSDKSNGGSGVPNSISIRSSGFLAVKNPSADGTHRLRLSASPVLSGSECGPQICNKGGSVVASEGYSTGHMYKIWIGYWC